MSSSHDPFDFSRYTGPTKPPASSDAPPQQHDWQTGNFTFGSADAGWEPEPGTSLEAGRPPMGFLVAAAALGALGLLAALLLGNQVGVASAAWFASGPLAIGLLALFTLRDTQARARPIYTAPSWTRAAYVSTFCLCLLGILVSALRIADWVGRLGIRS